MSRPPVSSPTMSSVNASRRSTTSPAAPTAGRGCIGRYATRACTSAGSGWRGSCATKGLVGRCRRRWIKTTISDPDVVAVDLLKRTFGPGTVELDRVYVGDITYIRTWEGWLYLATVIDLASRRVVGWAHGRPHARRAGLRRAPHGDREPSARAGCDLPLRPRHPIHLERVHRPARRTRDDPVALTAAAVLGQRRRGELLRVAQTRVHLPPSTGRPAPTRAGPCSTTSRCSSTGAGCTPSLGYLHTRRLREQDPQHTTPLTRHNHDVRRTGSTPAPRMLFVCRRGLGC